MFRKEIVERGWMRGLAVPKDFIVGKLDLLRMLALACTSVVNALRSKQIIPG